MSEECKNCTDGLLSPTHDEEHPGICCDCFDLGWGMPVEQLNRERAGKGLPPIEFRKGAKS